MSGSGLKLQLGTFVHFLELQSSLAVALLITHAPSYAQKETRTCKAGQVKPPGLARAPGAKELSFTSAPSSVQSPATARGRVRTPPLATVPGKIAGSTTLYGNSLQWQN